MKYDKKGKALADQKTLYLMREKDEKKEKNQRLHEKRYRASGKRGGKFTHKINMSGKSDGTKIWYDNRDKVYEYKKRRRIELEKLEKEKRKRILEKIKRLKK
tara:strand:- start:154 stop:459 length:306 start_codon:yes stop_codon:yes gene_type:complete